MKSKAIVCAIAALSLGIGSVSFAQGYDRNRDNNDRQGAQQRDNNDRRGNYQRDNRDQHGAYDRGNGRAEMGNRGDRNDQYRNGQYYYGARGPEWRRGGHIPPQYRDRQYVVNDWRGHHLNAPPRGYQWVQVGGDYVLVAVATGIIAQLLLNQ
jgi:Ni/Co efflux regulator RcnB